MKRILTVLSVFISISVIAQTYTDKPFNQDYADKFELNDEVKSANLLQVRSDRNKAVNILSSEGVLLAWEKELTKNNLYRPISDMKVIALDSYHNQFVYLTDSAVLSNAWAGKFYIAHGIKNPTHFAIGPDFKTLIASQSELALYKGGKKIWSKTTNEGVPFDLQYDEKGERFMILTKNAVYELGITTNTLAKIYEGANLTAMALQQNSIVLGTTNGILTVSEKPYKVSEINQKLPWTEITMVRTINEKVWLGSTKGAFKLRDDGKFDYYASKRWLVDDEVVDITKGPANSVLILTKTGLSKINIVKMTLAEKADYFQEIQRLRHIRYGLTSDLTLKTPGDITSGYYRDTDNDGLWTSIYLAGELFRYAVTKSEDAKLNAYEAFEGMERLTDITGLNGFPSRSYERDGYELGLGSNGFSEEWRKKFVKENGRIWRLSEDKKWRWKSSTSSDESCGHFFVYALFAELAPDKEWRDRAIHQIKIEMDHIMDNDWYLVDWNGKPTAWGKWHPDYVNSFPINVGDRRLNSTLILSFLQTTYRFTGDKKYKKAAEKLIKKYGYDNNANRLASVIGYEEGEALSDKWNHSDDQMYFLTIPSFVNYSFTDEQKQKHFTTVKSHWEEERSEKNPVWNYLFALSGGKNLDSEESAWWLREFPMDLIGWSIDNSHRKDLTRVEDNFRGQEYTEVLPGDERPLHSHNGAYRNNGGGKATREYAPYLYLMPYWAGRYVEAISAPKTE